VVRSRSRPLQIALRIRVTSLLRFLQIVCCGVRVRRVVIDVLGLVEQGHREPLSWGEIGDV
jgi:hypothetical protein